MGESGSGKTTAMRTLNPEETYYIDCDGKGLSWKGWRNQYNAEKKNYLRTDNQNDVLAVMRGISDKRPNIKNIVIDTINSIMIALSCVSNIGPSLSNDIGANITWSGMPDYIKWVLSLLMLMGRLEIMTVLVLFTRNFWKEN